VPAQFVEFILQKGCNYLSLHKTELIVSLSLKNASSKLLYLDMDHWTSDAKNDTELIGSCHNLQKLSIKSLFLTSDLARHIGIQNGQTLKVLNLECVNISHYWQLQTGYPLQTLQIIIDNCVNLEEISFMSDKNNVPLIEDTISYLVNNLTEKLRQLKLDMQPNLKDEHVKTLVSRCKRITALDLSHCKITDVSIDHIMNYLSPTLEKLNVNGCHKISDTKIMKLKSMPKLKVLHFAHLSLIVEMQMLKTELSHLSINEEKLRIAGKRRVSHFDSFLLMLQLFTLLKIFFYFRFFNKNMDFGKLRLDRFKCSKHL
jgi:hypothetical protein